MCRCAGVQVCRCVCMYVCVCVYVCMYSLVILLLYLGDSAYGEVYLSDKNLPNTSNIDAELENLMIIGGMHSKFIVYISSMHRRMVHMFLSCTVLYLTGIRNGEVVCFIAESGIVGAGYGYKKLDK